MAGAQVEEKAQEAAGPRQIDCRLQRVLGVAGSPRLRRAESQGTQGQNLDLQPHVIAALATS